VLPPGNQGRRGRAMTAQEGSWANLFRISALFLPLAGFLVLCGQAVQVYLDTLPLPPANSASSGYVPFSPSFLQSFDFVGFHALLFNSEYSLLTLGVLAFLPAVIALFVALRSTDVGISTVALALSAVGVVFVLLAAVDAFTEIQEAVTWDGGCTSCGNTPISLAFGTSAGGVALQLGELLIVVGILVLSVLMLRNAAFGKVSGVLGIVAALYALVGVFLFSSLSELDSDIGAASAFLLFALWELSVAPRMLRLGRSNPNPGEV
jgi:hypothetical protein